MLGGPAVSGTRPAGRALVKPPPALHARGRRRLGLSCKQGGAHYHIVHEGGGEEEVHKDEAIGLLLAANGFE